MKNEASGRRSIFVLLGILSVFLVLGILGMKWKNKAPTPVKEKEIPSEVVREDFADDGIGAPEFSSEGMMAQADPLSVPDAPAAAPSNTQLPVSAGGGLKYPSSDTLREEIEADPHLPPASLMQFAMDLAPRMEAAFQSESNAEELYRDLEDCLANDEAPIAVQAVCLGNAKILSRQHKSLSGRFEAMKTQAHPEVLELL